MNVDKLVNLMERALDNFEAGYAEAVSILQELINSGEVWWMNDTWQNTAKNAITDGRCVLPERSFTSCYGEHIPSRAEVIEEHQKTIDAFVYNAFAGRA